MKTESLHKEEKDLLKKIGSHIRRHRRLNDLTQADLSEMSGVSRVHISNTENGGRNLTVTSLHRIARALNTSIHALVVVDDGEGVTFSLSPNQVGSLLQDGVIRIF